MLEKSDGNHGNEIKSYLCNLETLVQTIDPSDKEYVYRIVNSLNKEEFDSLFDAMEMHYSPNAQLVADPGSSLP